MNMKKYGKKLVGNDEERAVSPVIGVILMVAITVILAAVIAAFVLDLGQSTGANPQAGFSFDDGSSGVEITLTSIERGENFEAHCDGVSSSEDHAFSGVGDTSSEICDGDTVTITGEYDGNEAVITQYDDHI